MSNFTLLRVLNISICNDHRYPVVMSFLSVIQTCNKKVTHCDMEFVYLDSYKVGSLKKMIMSPNN